MSRLPERIESLLDSRGVSRRTFLSRCAQVAAAGSLLVPAARALAEPPPAGPRKARGARGAHDLVVAKGNDPAENTRKAIEAIGGMKQFVKPGAVVVVKPNMAWDRVPEQAGNTNPAVVATVVSMCLAAGAKRVNVFDRPCNDRKRCYDRSGIKAAAEAKGAKVYFVDDWNAVAAKFPYESPMAGWPVFRDAVECDTLINIPILKHHGLTGLTLSMKNFMGVCLGDRGDIHEGIGRRLADMTDFLKPDLTIIDAYRVLTDHGPSGGSLKDVATRKTVIVGTDPVLADAYAAEFMGSKPLDIPFIAEGAARKVGSADLKAAKIRTLGA
jgi:uncharacterized protein (DUF362 family)